MRSEPADRAGVGHQLVAQADLLGTDFNMWRSLPQMPHASTLASTCPARADRHVFHREVPPVITAARCGGPYPCA
jgi:hypothetical protein